MPRDEQLIQAGKEYGAVYSIWGKFRDIIERGSRYLDVNPSLLPDTYMQPPPDFQWLTDDCFGVVTEVTGKNT